MIRKILLVVLLLLVVIQFIRPSRNSAQAITDNDITKVYPVPDSVQKILDKACYDCHSNTTRYPWYANVQPVGWWLRNHINKGKKHLNFSEYGSYTMKRKVQKMKGISDEINNGEMPLDSYLWIHKDAVLSMEEQQTVIKWANAIYAQMPDSLKKKKGEH